MIIDIIIIIGLWGHSNAVSGAAWMSSCGLIATASWDRSALLFDVASGGSKPLRTLAAHDGPLSSIAAATSASLPFPRLPTSSLLPRFLDKLSSHMLHVLQMVPSFPAACRCCPRSLPTPTSALVPSLLPACSACLARSECGPALVRRVDRQSMLACCSAALLLQRGGFPQHARAVSGCKWPSGTSCLKCCKWPSGTSCCLLQAQAGCQGTTCT